MDELINVVDILFIKMDITNITELIKIINDEISMNVEYLIITLTDDSNSLKRI